MASPHTSAGAGVLLMVFAVVGLCLAATTLPWLVVGFTDGFDVGGIVWILATLAVAVPLLVGLIRRERGTEPSTPLLLIGSLAPSFAWFWLPPVYLLTVAIAVSALASRPRSSAGNEVRP
jgi:hypothetical protein